MGENRIFVRAVGVSVVLHLVLAAVTWKLPFIPDIDPALAQAADEVELWLEEPSTPLDEAAAAADDPDQPQRFTSIPDRLAAAEPPEKADFIGDHDALAADHSGGAGDTPRADREGEFPHVAINQEEVGGGGDNVEFATPPPPAQQEAGGQTSVGEGEGEEKKDERTADGRGEWVLPDERSEPAESLGDNTDDVQSEPLPPTQLEDWWQGTSPSVLKEGEPAVSGDRGFRFDQEAVGDLGAGVAIDGEYSLNTYKWNYAPWIKHFSNELYQHWIPPYAYKLGVISGTTKLRIVVAKSGRLLDLEVLDTKGHDSLHTASQAAFRAFAPYPALPPDFPLPNLVIICTLEYPAWRR